MNRNKKENFHLWEFCEENFEKSKWFNAWIFPFAD